MRNKTFKKFIMVMLFVCLLMISTNIYASNFNTSLEIDSNNQNNKNIVLILKLKEVNFENIISTIEANLEYDKEVFSEATIENLNEWSILYNNENGKLVGFKVSDQEINQEELCKITLKIKENVTNASTQIVMKDIKSADGDNLVATEDKIVSIDIGEGAILSAEEQKAKITDKNMLKYLLLLVIVVLVITIVTSTTFLFQKRKMQKLYEGSRPRNNK